MQTPLATLEVLSARAAMEPEGTIAIPVRDHVNTATMMSLLHADFSFLEERVLDRIIIQGSILTMQRNEAVQKTRGNFLLFIDDDMVFAPSAIKDLMASYEELMGQLEEPFMVGALCFRRSKPYPPTMLMRESATEGPYTNLEEWEDGLVEVDATGCAFLLIPVEVFEAIAGTPMPSYEERQRLGGMPSFFRWAKQYGEDLQFCQDAKAAGVRIFVDTRIEIKHVTEIEVGTREYLEQMAQRTPVEYVSRMTANKRMGLPTMTRQKARDLIGW